MILLATHRCAWLSPSCHPACFKQKINDDETKTTPFISLSSKHNCSSLYLSVGITLARIINYIQYATSVTWLSTHFVTHGPPVFVQTKNRILFVFKRFTIGFRLSYAIHLHFIIYIKKICERTFELIKHLMTFFLAYVSFDEITNVLFLKSQIIVPYSVRCAYKFYKSGLVTYIC